ncbi:hypothetical protein [Fervidobacterium sp.]
MKLIPRKVVSTIALLMFFSSLLLSIFYFKNATYVYLSNLEKKFQEVRSLYQNINRLEEETKRLEVFKNKWIKSEDVIIDEELSSEEVIEKLQKILSEKLISTDYTMIKSLVDEPVVFKNVHTKYKFIFKGSN